MQCPHFNSPVYYQRKEISTWWTQGFEKVIPQPELKSKETSPASEHEVPAYFLTQLIHQFYGFQGFYFRMAEWIFKIYIFSTKNIHVSFQMWLSPNSSLVTIHFHFRRICYIALLVPDLLVHSREYSM